VQRRAAREIEDAVAVSHEVAGEEVVAASLAVPLRQRAASDVRLDGEAGEELVDLDVVGELLAVRDARGDRVLPAELRALDVQVVSDDQRACLVGRP